MKIGIYTLPLHTNYGGILQAYALQKVLKNLGHDAWLINRPKTFKIFWIKAPLIYLKRMIKKYILLENGTKIFLEQHRKREYEIISVNTQKFINEYIQPSLNIVSLKKIPNNIFEVIVVGSDQIWRPKYNKPKIENSFLDFAKKQKRLKRIAYAASFGTSIWEYNRTQTERCKSLISKFDAVSVREDSGIELCKTYFNIDADLVADPTMLLSKSDYIKIANTYKKDINGELFVYILDTGKEKEKVIEYMSKNCNMIPFTTSTDNSNVEIEKRITSPIEYWLKSFYYSKFIITDSFHACVFSIIFNKPFYTIANQDRGSARFFSLLKLFQLEHRLIKTVDEIDFDKAFSINWDRTNEILNQQKELSIRFLIDSLSEI
ncbi:polysaccharide pyruvyl transferase family protein [uncultured Draconibacterium sp.]|uniref:polysaccharide pyruvyl transferase family protein n=1 Tax=uncultured Draconibacterium sp. TaxID=1573823 RepID=UPI002AA665B3|nr:polysaccharide pyruvyl transferase family protein [uncultured Draconibacterium sp.]